jgi:predicted  nucleic acid-binding Zn-ribbon protein
VLEGDELEDLSRRVRKLRRKVYRQTPVASPSRIAELDHRMAYSEMTRALERSQLGVLSGGAALALWRACTERGLRAWCYEFGFPESLTQAVTIVDIDGEPQVHDAFFNTSYSASLHDILTALRDGSPVSGKRGVRDRKIYIADPGREPEATVGWLEAHADRELEPIDGLRRFELLWRPEAFTATHPEIERVSRDLAARGYHGDLQFLMLHPVGVFDGAQWHRDSGAMPLLGDRDLTSPVAALRVATRDLQTERARLAESTAKIKRVETDLGDANSRLSAASQRLAADRDTWLQQKVVLQASKTALEGEIREAQARLSAAIDLRAQRDSQIAQLRAEIEDLRLEWDSGRLRLEAENRDLEMRASAADEQVIEVSHYLASLINEVNQLRGEYRAVVTERDALLGERARLEAQIAASPSARLRSLWHRLTRRRGDGIRY